MNKEKKVIDDIEFENASLMFNNFSGRASQYNRQGDRNFCVIIPNEQLANELIADGWNVKTRGANHEDDDDVTYYIQVKVRYNHDYPQFNPKIVLVSGNNKTELNEETVSLIDQIDIQSVDLVVRPRYYETMDRSGIAAYLRTMYVVQRVDRFASKYE